MGKIKNSIEFEMEYEDNTQYSEDYDYQYDQYKQYTNQDIHYELFCMGRINDYNEMVSTYSKENKSLREA